MIVAQFLAVGVGLSCGRERSGFPLRSSLVGSLLPLPPSLGGPLGKYEAEPKISPYRFNSLYGAGQAAEIAKQPGKATAYYQQLLKVCASGNSNRVELAHAQEFLSTVAAQN